jgi:signal transduction histidine kinase
MSEVFSVRLPDGTADRLRTHAAQSGEPVSRSAHRLIEEGLRMAAHPGIVFRSGPSGRRAALLRGPDVWEVVSLLRSLEAREEAAIEDAADELGTPVAAVRQALAYYGEFPDEIEAEIAANEKAAESARRSLERQDRLVR